MFRPTVAGRAPLEVELQPGQDYYWCSCGLSKRQPFCDGSHITTLFTPVRFRVEEAGKRYLCACKQSGDAPYCNGAHESLTDEETS